MPGAEIVGDTIAFPADSPQLGTLRTVEALPERESFVRINGRASWDESRTTRVSSPVAGRVVELRVMPGAGVRKGDVLAVIASPELGTAQADARRADTDLAEATRTLERARALYEAGVIPQKELYAAEAVQKRAQAERDRAGARERLLGGSGAIDQQYRLLAPIAGTVVDRRINVGQEVRPDAGPDQPLFVISDPSHLWVTLDVPETLVREIAVGESVRIQVPALPGEVFSAVVEYVADHIDPQTRTVRARAAVENAARRLKAEMYVSADVEVPPSRALKVPATAVYLQGERFFAFVEEKPGTFTRRPLRAEEATLGFMRVLEGLSPGERVVADGALLLQRMLTQKATEPPQRGKGPPSGPSPDAPGGRG